ncbi:MAG TPA: DUF3499 family protein [Acidimicrobiia bacterium]|nr:DUF3499 family protein [Acidimicrobiia bacterium]
MRICARSGCNSPATATLTYDRIALVAYLADADDPAAREPGDLCERHVARLVLPRQWQLDDRRAASTSAAASKPRAKKLRVVRDESQTAKSTPVATKPRPKRARATKAQKWTEVEPSLFDPPADSATAVTAATAAGDHLYMPRFGPETDDEVLEAKTPLLRRAFGGQ